MRDGDPNATICVAMIECAFRDGSARRFPIKVIETPH
jgi:hypothetical protein